MTDTLGLHVDETGDPPVITAVRLDAVEVTEALVVELGRDGPAAVCAVAEGDGGAVLVGAAALESEGAVVRDPLQRAADGRIGALLAVVNHVVGRAVAATGSAPGRLAVVVPDDWTVDARDRVVEAGVAAGIRDTVVVPRSAATLRSVVLRPDLDEDDAARLHLAAGAAEVASLAAAPIVTREDLGDSAEPTQPAPVVDEPISGSVSVFDEADDPDPTPAPPEDSPARAPVAPVGAAPTTGVTPAVPAAGVNGGSTSVGPPPVEPLRYEPPRRRAGVLVVLTVIVLGLIAAVGGALIFLTGDDNGTSTTDTPTTLTPTTVTTVVPTSAPTTTLAPASSTTTSSTTTSTTTSSTTTTTTTEPPSTTTTPVAVGEPGVVTLVETGLQFEGGDLVLFDQDADSVVDQVADMLGDPDLDAGYEANAFCLGERTRIVVWGDLELVFTEDDADSETGRFTQWYASGHDDPEGLVTISGVGVSATVGLLEVTFGDALVLVEAIPDDPVGLFAVTNPGSGAILNGTTTTRDPDGIVISLWAGDSCTRIFT